MTDAPERGDLVWLDFDPQAGHEQAGRRPALVLSPQIYNKKSGLLLACPVTSRAKGYTFEVPLPEGAGVSGVILADQVKSCDWKVRVAGKAGRVSEAVVVEVTARLAPLLGI